MYENPLLPNRKLQELFALMQRARKLDRAKTPRLEALIAASLMHLEPGDFVAVLPGSVAASEIAAHYTLLDDASALPKAQRLATAAGIAKGLQLSGKGRVAAFYLIAGAGTARTEQGWREALTYAATARLPLILLCADIVSPKSRTEHPDAVTFETISKLARPLRLPVLTVDGSDAVAVYRVMQESVLRARTVGGVAVIWCLLQPEAKDPLVHMRRYLADRKLLPSKAAVKRPRKTAKQTQPA